MPKQLRMTDYIVGGEVKRQYFYEDYHNRLATYEDFQSLPDKPLACDLARSGFISLGHIIPAGSSPSLFGGVICPWCKLAIQGLETDTPVLACHRALSNNPCPFLKGEKGQASSAEEKLPGADAFSANEDPQAEVPQGSATLSDYDRQQKIKRYSSIEYNVSMVDLKSNLSGCPVIIRLLELEGQLPNAPESSGNGLAEPKEDFVPGPSPPIEDDLLCKICMNGVNRVLYVPCKHAVCDDCAHKIGKPENEETFCPMCRGLVEAKINIIV